MTGHSNEIGQEKFIHFYKSIGIDEEENTMSLYKMIDHFIKKDEIKELAMEKSSFLYGEYLKYLSLFKLKLGLYHESKILALQCLTQSKIRSRVNYSLLLNNYLEEVGDDCRIILGLNHFENKRFDQAVKVLKEVPKKSLLWPKTLLVLSWSYYYLGELNKVVGITSFSRSPLFAYYNQLEFEYLRLLSLIDLCLYDQALEDLNQFEDKISFIEGKIETRVHDFERDNHNSKKALLALDLYFNLESFYDYHSLAFDDLKKIAGHKIEEIKKHHQFLLVEANKMKLKIFNTKKEIHYQNKSLLFHEERSSLGDVESQTSQEFWPFNGEVWADELGDYSYALKNNCEVDKI